MSDWLTWQLVDSAFPMGTFAHSWGLEAAWHQGEVDSLDDLRSFLHASIQQTGFTAMPLLTACYQDPGDLERLDALADAFLMNAVANRASRVQGRTLLATVARIWPSEEISTLKRRTMVGCTHLAPLSGVVFRVLGLSLPVAQRVILYGGARGVLAAAVRLGIAGSYEAQRLQYASIPWLDVVAERCGALTADDIGQVAPILDLLQAGHDRLYSRLFQS